MYDREFGKSLLEKYLGREQLQKRKEHSLGVAEFAFKVALQIKKRNPELTDFDPEFVGFLGYVHDIGYSTANNKHEVHTIDILTKEEGIPYNVARMVMHGQLAEQFGEKEGDAEKYLPVGLEGMILTYADMSVRTGDPTPIRHRAEEIASRIQSNPAMSAQLKQEIIDGLQKALPRFEKYERIVLALAGVRSVNDF